MLHPYGAKITFSNYESIDDDKNKLLNLNKAIIFEATLRCDNLLIRIDVLEKDRNTIKLIEAKAKYLMDRI